MEVVVVGNRRYTYLDGKLHSFNDKPSLIVFNDNIDVLNYDDGIINDTNDTRFERYYHKHGILHREYGPASIIRNTEGWYKNGVLHNEYGPAEIRKERKCWFINGNLHREDGPAVIWDNGDAEWWLNGEYQYGCSGYIEPRINSKSARKLKN